MTKKKGGFMSRLWDVREYVKEVGLVNAIAYAFLLIFFSMVLYLVKNPEYLFDKYTEYAERKHTESFQQRMEVSPLVQSTVDKLRIEERSLRSFVVEMHNGKYNSAGLSFNYGMLTYESLSDSVESVKEDYADFSLERYPILMHVYKTGYWAGNVEELKKIDNRLALRLESNNASYMALAMIYGESESIGFVGITYKEGDKISKDETRLILLKYSSMLSPLLDGNKDKK